MNRIEQLLCLGVPRNIAAKVGEAEPKRPAMRVEASVDGDIGEITIYEQIGLDWWTGEGMTAQKFGDILGSMAGKSKIVVRLNSPGGDFYDGLTIYNMLLQQPNATEVRIDGIAASAASIVAMGGDRVVMSKVSQIMIHNAWWGVRGGKEDLRAAADVLELIDAQIAEVYAQKSGKPAEAFAELMAAETYLTPDAAMSYGLADGVIESAKKQPAKASAEGSPLRAKAKLFSLRNRFA